MQCFFYYWTFGSTVDVTLYESHFEKLHNSNRWVLSKKKPAWSQIKHYLLNWHVLQIHVQKGLLVVLVPEKKDLLKGGKERIVEICRGKVPAMLIKEELKRQWFDIRALNAI